MRSMVEGECRERGVVALLPLHHPSGGPPPPTGEEGQLTASSRDAVRLGKVPEILGVYLLTINAATVTAFALDKRAAARGGWRTPERRLLALAALGGSPGALAARALFRHKTRKAGFSAWLWGIAVAQAALAVWLAYRAFR